jgi:mannose-6-phosphate isomerase-like protein (cupin superfamily)
VCCGVYAAVTGPIWKEYPSRIAAIPQQVSGLERDDSDLMLDRGGRGRPHPHRAGHRRWVRRAFVGPKAKDRNVYAFGGTLLVCDPADALCKAIHPAIVHGDYSLGMGIEPFHVAASGGTKVPLPVGGAGLIKAGVAQTGNAMAVFELTIPAMQGPGLHIHTHDDELWYVLEGEFRVKAGGKMFAVSSGELVFGPRGLPHAFQNVTDAPGRLLVITTPSGLEGFFEDFARRPAGSVDAEGLTEIGHAYGVDFVGPPLSISDPL